STNGQYEIQSLDDIGVETNAMTTLTTEQNGILLKMEYPYFITKDKDVSVKVSMTNKGKPEQMGGVSIGFPSLTDIDGIKSKTGNFETIMPYASNSKLWSGEQGRSIYSQYLMVEGWQKGWSKGVTKKMEVTIPSYKVRGKQFNIYVRGVLVTSRMERVIPTQGTKGQQGYQNSVLTVKVVD
ncbi:MAG: hypothetical protein JXQ76_13310, partial [Campylobacterales bacterium]|nr:hypothetical protein [Campylobacterales bacterium]